jgi:hypothetical protein
MSQTIHIVTKWGYILLLKADKLGVSLNVVKTQPVHSVQLFVPPITL